MTLIVEMAGLRIRMEHRFETVRRLCREYTVPDAERAEFTVRVSEAEIQNRMARVPESSRSEAWTEAGMLYEKISNALPAFDAYVLHASVVAVDGAAYAFAARPGVGKSTHTGYWRQMLGERVTVINGDKPILRFAEDGRLIAYGTPWNGKENWGTNTAAPIRAICLLERGTENAVFPIPAEEALREMLAHIHLTEPSETDLPRLLRLLERTMQSVPAYRLRCKNEVSAAETAIRALLPDGASSCENRGRRTE